MIKIVSGNCLNVLKTIKSNSIHSCITSPPYWKLRDYGIENQIGQESCPEQYVEALVQVFQQVKRVLRDDGTLWLNLGDSYATNLGNAKTKLKKRFLEKNLIGIPWRVAFALQNDGWCLRQDIIWHKTNPMPESVRDRCTKSHEYIFLFSKTKKYYFDVDSIKEPSIRPNEKQVFGGKKAKENKIEKNDPRYRNGSEQWGRTIYTPALRHKRSVWSVSTKPFKGAHFATFPPDLIKPCILAGCPPGGTVLDPFIGAGTTAVVSKTHNRNCIGIEINSEYVKMAEKRISLIDPY